MVTLTLTLTAALLAAPPLSIGAKHPTVTDTTRFITDRDVPALPLPAEDESFFFVIFGDRTGGPADGVKILAEAVRETNLLEPDLVMTVGDLVEGYNQTEQWIVQMREFRGIMDKLLCPWFPVAGNHDVYWRGSGRPEGEHEASYEMHFGPLWYAFEHKDCWFIVLYSDEGNPETSEKNFQKPECQVMSPQQFSWLQGTLDRAADARHVFLFLHHPRWFGGQYGDDWERVHAELVAAGNVRAVFAGHIHRMRYDGPRDGIEYVALATTGGVQEGHAPAAGYLHHYDIVTVRPNQIAMAAVPVGELMDVRAISGQISNDAERLARTLPRVEPSIPIDEGGAVRTAVTVELSNPVGRPIEFVVAPTSADRHWSWTPDHEHGRLQPGESQRLTFDVRRAARPIDEMLRALSISVDVDYLTESARYPIRRRRLDVPMRPELSPPATGVETALGLDGDGAYLRLDSRHVAVPDGPLTVECWVRPRTLYDSAALVSKTELSEFGLQAGTGAPSFWIFLDAAYVTVFAPEPVLEAGRWHHVAGVFDGSEVRLYVDGRRVIAAPGSGVRRTNELPLQVGAEVTGNGLATNHLDGLIDEVRVSTTARYSGTSFTPRRRFEPDADTALLLHLDGRVGPWVYDASPQGAHPMIVGSPVFDQPSR